MPGNHTEELATAGFSPSFDDDDTVNVDDEYDGGGSSCRHVFPVAVVSPVRRLVSPSFGPAVVSPVDVVSVGGWSILIVGWVEMAGDGDGG
ncbi:hypothetical protein Hanom_Chr01g00062031 [Helianthus anomalus]